MMARIICYTAILWVLIIMLVTGFWHRMYPCVDANGNATEYASLVAYVLNRCSK